ncbi:MAG: hypothetical protein RQ826_10060, partial [Xanthomonadales bacterium]|nr:hypothetical protein [Xanthomonadales bacterium]
MNITRQSNQLRAGLVAAGFLAAVEATAQQTLEEVVVTAEKRQSTVLDTALAISAFDQAALNRSGITR